MSVHNSVPAHFEDPYPYQGPPGLVPDDPGRRCAGMANQALGTLHNKNIS